MKSPRLTFGITLIELLVALAVLTVGLLLVTPGFSTISGNTRLETQSREIQNALVFARSEAIRLNRNVVFCNTSDGQICSEPPTTGWEGWLVRAAGVTVGAETGPVLRTQSLKDSSARVDSGPVLATAQHVLRFNSQGLIRVFGNNTPLSDVIRICIPDASLNPNLFEVRFNSGGRLQQVSSDTDGECT